MALLLIGGVVLTSVPLAVFALRKGADDRIWEGRWRSLSDLDRAWIAAASLSEDSAPVLAERGETELADGFGRRELRRRSYVALATLPAILAAAFLILAGVLGEFLAGPVMFTAGLVLFLYNRRRESGIRNCYRELQPKGSATPGI